MPSSSARCAQFPRAQDKVHFYIKLRELRDQLKGVQKSREIEEIQYTFDLKLAKGKHRLCGSMYVWFVIQPVSGMAVKNLFSYSETGSSIVT